MTSCESQSVRNIDQLLEDNQNFIKTLKKKEENKTIPAEKFSNVVDKIVELEREKKENERPEVTLSLKCCVIV